MYNRTYRVVRVDEIIPTKARKNRDFKKENGYTRDTVDKFSNPLPNFTTQLHSR